MIPMPRRHFLEKTVAAFAATVSLFTTPAFTASARNPVNHTVDITGFTFSPMTLRVRAGDRVTWINKDIVPHTATAKDRSWDTGKLAPNGRKTITVKEGLSESYFCRFHPSMTAKLDLKQPRSVSNIG